MTNTKPDFTTYKKKFEESANQFEQWLEKNADTVTEEAKNEGNTFLSTLRESYHSIAKHFNDMVGDDKDAIEHRMKALKEKAIQKKLEWTD